MPARRPAWYASKYCEENAWHLAQDALTAHHAARYVLFVSNPTRTCALWSQRAAHAPGAPVVWDYHVVVLGLGPAATLYDLDSRVAFPVPAARWLDATFPVDDAIDPVFRPRFRVVEAGAFVAAFASDRSHMRAADGGWFAPPPATPLIRTAAATMNLDRFVDTEQDFEGELLPDLASLRRWIDAPR